MCHEDNGATMVAENVFQHLLLRLHIKRTCSLIQQHDTTWTEQGTRNSDALGLSLTKSPTLLGETGIKSIRQFGYKISTSHLQSFPHLMICSLRTSQLQVLAQRATKQSIPLRNIDKVATMEGGELREKKN